MGRVTMGRTVDAPADVVWDVVADHDVYASVAPNLSTVEVVEGEGEGMRRRCVDTDGNAWTESCHRWEDGRRYAMTVQTASSDFHRRLFTRFEGEWRLSPRDDGVLVEIQFDYDAKYGPLGWLVERYLERRAPSLVEPIFDGWEAEIAARLDGSVPEDPGTRRAGADAPPTRRSG